MINHNFYQYNKHIYHQIKQAEDFVYIRLKQQVDLHASDVCLVFNTTLKGQTNSTKCKHTFAQKWRKTKQNKVR